MRAQIKLTAMLQLALVPTARGLHVIAIDVFVFGLAWWLGLYLLARNPATPLLVRAGLGLLCFALALGAATLSRAAGAGAPALWLARAHWLLIFLPALLWAGALLALLPDEWAGRARLNRLWRTVVLPAGVALAALVASEAPPLALALPGARYLLAALATLLPLAFALAQVLRFRRAIRPHNQAGLLIGVGLFFGLGVGLLLFPLPWIGHTAKLLMIEFDLVALGLGIALFDALDEGELLRRDLLHSAAGSSAAALLFGLQVALALALGAAAALPMQALLLAVVAAAIGLAVLADPLAGALDRLVFAGAPAIRRERAELRSAASALPRLNERLALAQLDEAEFVRLTRRALSHYGDLPRLASSPLTQLPLIDERLAARQTLDDALERATELKTVLAECVARLKPRGDRDFGSSDEWRYYNALFFPYIVGLKPYSRRAEQAPAEPAQRQALEWFQATVPERTLHNWQSAAARLIARDLRGRAAYSGELGLAPEPAPERT